MVIPLSYQRGYYTRSWATEVSGTGPLRLPGPGMFMCPFPVIYIIRTS